MEHEILDLKIANRAKDQVIDHLRTERDGIIDQLLNASRRVGELETKLLQLSPPVDATAALDENGDVGNVISSTGDGQFSDPISH